MHYSEIKLIFDAIKDKNVDNIEKLVSFLDFVINENIIKDNKNSVANDNAIRYLAINNKKEFKPVVDYLFNRFPECFNSEFFIKLFEIENSENNLSENFRNLVDIQKNSYRRKAVPLNLKNLYYIDYFSTNFIQEMVDNTDFMFVNIDDKKSSVIEYIAHRGVKFKAGHFIGSLMSEEVLSNYVDINEPVNDFLPTLFKNYPLSIKEYNSHLKNKDSVHFNFIHHYYENMGQTYIHKIRELFEELKSNYEQLSTYKFDDLTAAELILYRDFSMIKKMVDVNRFKITTEEEGIKLKKYLESNKYLKNIDNLIDKLKIMSLLQHEDIKGNDTMTYQNIISGLNIISPYNEDKKFIDMYMLLRETINYPKYFHHLIPKNIIPLLRESFSDMDLKQHDYFFKSQKNNSTKFLDMLPTISRYMKGELIRPSFTDILNEETKGQIVSLELLKKQPEFFYGFINNTFREKNKNVSDYKMYHELETLWESTESVNKRKRDITL